MPEYQSTVTRIETDLSTIVEPTRERQLGLLNELGSLCIEFARSQEPAQKIEPLEKARSAYEMARSLEPKNWLHYYNLARTYKKLGGAHARNSKVASNATVNRRIAQGADYSKAAAMHIYAIDNCEQAGERTKESENTFLICQLKAVNYVTLGYYDEALVSIAFARIEKAQDPEIIGLELSVYTLQKDSDNFARLANEARAWHPNDKELQATIATGMEKLDLVEETDAPVAAAARPTKTARRPSIKVMIGQSLKP